MNEPTEKLESVIEEQSTNRMRWLVVLAILSVVGLVAWMMLSSGEDLQ